MEQALRSPRRASARGRAPGETERTNQRALSPRALRIGRSVPASLRTVGGPRRERPGIGAPAAPESQGRVRGLASAAGGWSRAASRRSCWRRRRRRRLAVGRGRGLKAPRWGGSGVSGFFIRCFEGRRTEGCRFGRVEEPAGASGSAAPGAWR